MRMHRDVRTTHHPSPPHGLTLKVAELSMTVKGRSKDGQDYSLATQRGPWASRGIIQELVRNAKSQVESHTY